MLKVRPIELKQANAFIGELHRHHKPVQGHRFSISAYEDDVKLVGVCVVGRPVARGYVGRRVVEVTRLCTDGTKNVCSLLYAAAARIAREMGYDRIQTYILDDEPGITLVAAGWVYERNTVGGQWNHSSGPRRTDQPTCPKQRWAKVF